MGRLMQVLALLVLLIAAVAGSRFTSLESSREALEYLTADVAETNEKQRESEDRETHVKGTEGDHVTGTGPGDVVLQYIELRNAVPLNAEPVNTGSLDAEPVDTGSLDAESLDTGPLDAELLDTGPSAEDENPSVISEGASTEHGWTEYDNSVILVQPNSTGTISAVVEDRDENDEAIDDVDADSTRGTNATYWRDEFRAGDAVSIGTDYGLGSYYGTDLYNATASLLAQQSNSHQTKLESESDIKQAREQIITSAAEVTADVVKMNRLDDKVGRQKGKRRGRFVLVRRSTTTTTTQPSTNEAVAATQPNKIVFENNVLLGTEDYLKLDAVDTMTTEPQNSLVVTATRPSLRLDLLSETLQSAGKPGEFRLPSSANYRGTVGPLKHSGLFPAKTSPFGKSLQSSVTETSFTHSNWLSPTVSTHNFDYLPTALSPPHSSLLPTAAPVSHWDLTPPSTVVPRHYSEVYDTNNILVSGRTFFFQSKNTESKPQEISSDTITLQPSDVNSAVPSKPPLALDVQQKVDSITEGPQESEQGIVINKSNNRLPRVYFSTANNDKARDDSFERQHQKFKDTSDYDQTSVVAKPVANTLDGMEVKRHKKRRTRGRFHTATKNGAPSDPRDVFLKQVGEESSIQKENSEEDRESLGTGKRLFRSSYLLPPPPHVGLLVRPRPRPRQYWTHPFPAPSYPPPPLPLPRPTSHHHPDGFLDGNPGSYDYGYGVADDYRGTYFGHVEKRAGVLTEGKYFVDLPDGRRMTVTYYADHTGYHPTVTYEARPTQTVKEDTFHGPDSYPDQYPSPGPVNNYLSNRNGLVPHYPAPFPHVHYVISHTGPPNYGFNRPYGNLRPSYAYPNSINAFQPSYNPNRNYFPIRQNNIGLFSPTQRPFETEDSQSPYTPISSNGGGQFAPNFPFFISTKTPLSSGDKRPPQGNMGQPTLVSNSPAIGFAPGVVSPAITNRGQGNDNFRPIFVPNDNRHFLNERQALHDQILGPHNQSEGPHDPALTSIEEHIANLHSKRSSASASTNNKPVFSINTKKKFTTRNADGMDDTVNKMSIPRE